MAPRPIHVDYQGQRFTVEYDDSEEFDLALIQAQIYSMTDLEPNMQQFQPALTVHNLGHIFSMSSRSPDIDPQLVLNSIDWQTACSRTWLGNEPAVQPGAQCDDIRLCIACARSCFSQRPLRPAQSAHAFACQCGNACVFKSRASSELLAEPFRGYLLQALSEQQILQDKMLLAKGNASFYQRIQASMAQVADFENIENQRKALAVIPLQTLLDRGKARGAEALNPKDELVFQLLHWFKNEFFSWVNSPPCDVCHKETTAVGNAAPTPGERQFGAGIVELHQCRLCGAMTRFPRYKDSGKLLETRRGRCGEWAQAFVLCCRALHYESRFVVDWTDHVWAEVYSEEKQRWVHCDPCENRYDAPLLYEAGWGKKLTYVIAFSVDEIRDVTRRYTTKFESELLPRRRSCQEDWLSATLQSLNQGRNKPLIEQRWVRELAELARIEIPSEPLPGRQTGSVEWRLARGELGRSVAAPIERKTLSKPELQALIKTYFSQMTAGCGKPDCENQAYCASAQGFKPRSHKELLSQSIIVARDYLDGKLCSRFVPAE